ncbi:MAG: pentapeptide repeat-containing protein, partial [Vogesella sp.]|uniref:pentapeptide repeat-containing protein n=1 Tax=Vogesella sp. TaxID=1904252 RepID=UPI003F334A38
LLRWSELAALKAANPADWWKQLATLTPSTKLDASFGVKLDVQPTIGGQSFTDIFGTPYITLDTDQLFRLSDEGLVVYQAPSVSVDVLLSATQKTQLLNVLDKLKAAGEGAFNPDFLSIKLPGIGKSLSELFGNKSADPGSSFFNRLLNLSDAANAYFNSTKLAATPPADAADATLLGLVNALNTALSQKVAIDFDASQSDWSGKNLANVSFAGLNLRGFNFNGADLTGADFSGADLTGATFAGANLSFAVFATRKPDGSVDRSTGKAGAARLEGVNFSGARLKGVNLGGLDLRAANFELADISTTVFDKASLVGASFAGSVVSASTSLANALFSGVLPAELLRATGTAIDLDPLTGAADLSGFDLSGFNFSGLDLAGIKLANAKLVAANLYGVKFGAANLAGADLSTAYLAKADLATATLSSATKLDGALFAKTDSVPTTGSGSALVIKQGTSLAGLNLSGYDFSGIDFNGVDLSGTRLVGAVFAGASLAGATLSDTSDFSQADLRGLAAVTAASGDPQISLPATLKGVFAGADLSGLNLSNISLSGLNLAGANLQGATVNGADFSLANLRAANLLLVSGTSASA